MRPRNARLIRVWYPGPFFLNQASTSASSRSVIGLLSGLYIFEMSAVTSRDPWPSSAEGFSRATLCPATLRPEIFRPFVTLACRFIYLPYVYLCTYILASTKCSTWNTRTILQTEHSPMHQAALQLTLSQVRKRMRSGDRPGLQNRRVAGHPVTGGFDPHSLPPFFSTVYRFSSSFVEPLRRF
jgi:hypothetical protein